MSGMGRQEKALRLLEIYSQLFRAGGGKPGLRAEAGFKLHSCQATGPFECKQGAPSCSLSALGVLVFSSLGQDLCKTPSPAGSLLSGFHGFPMDLSQTAPSSPSHEVSPESPPPFCF